MTRKMHQCKCESHPAHCKYSVWSVREQNRNCALPAVSSRLGSRQYYPESWNHVEKKGSLNLRILQLREYMGESRRTVNVMATEL